MQRETRRTMDRRQATIAYLQGQCRRYPELEPQDLLKALHQSVFGCGHFVTDAAAGLARLRAELAEAPCGGPDVEPLDGGFCRVHLSAVKRTGLAPETLFRIFALSAEDPAGTRAELEEKLSVLLELAEDGQLPFSADQIAAAIDNWRRAGYPACHHSEDFRAVYAPVYRVVRREFAWMLPLLAAIDKQMAAKPQVLLAIDGGSASGKTTLASWLEKIYGCQVFHMDDFFLRPQQRTAERLAEPGGNVDRERFYEEVLLPLTQGRTVQYRRYDCQTQTVGGPVNIRPGALNVVEGAYSMHPMLADSYDLSAFLRVPPEVQHARVLARNGPEIGERFFTRWIPLEQRYFDALDPAGRCDILLEVET